MKRVVPVLLSLVLLGSPGVSAQGLSDPQIDSILINIGKGDDAGLSLGEAFNMTCSGFRINVWSPEAWVRHQARRARKELRPFSAADVDNETRAGVWRIHASASIPSKVRDLRASCSDSVSHVVIRNKSATVVAQPVSKAPVDQTVSNAMGASFSFTGLEAAFNNEDVLELWGAKRDQHFWITVIGVNGWKYDFEVKSKHFKDLR